MSCFPSKVGVLPSALTLHNMDHHFRFLYWLSPCLLPSPRINPTCFNLNVIETSIINFCINQNRIFSICPSEVYGVTKSQTRLSNWITTTIITWSPIHFSSLFWDLLWGETKGRGWGAWHAQNSVGFILLSASVDSFIFQIPRQINRNQWKDIGRVKGKQVTYSPGFFPFRLLQVGRILLLKNRPVYCRPFPYNCAI